MYDFAQTCLLVAFGCKIDGEGKPVKVGSEFNGSVSYWSRHMKLVPGFEKWGQWAEYKDSPADKVVLHRLVYKAASLIFNPGMLCKKYVVQLFNKIDIKSWNGLVANTREGMRNRIKEVTELWPATVKALLFRIGNDAESLKKRFEAIGMPESYINSAAGGGHVCDRAITGWAFEGIREGGYCGTNPIVHNPGQQKWGVKLIIPKAQLDRFPKDKPVVFDSIRPYFVEGLQGSANGYATILENSDKTTAYITSAPLVGRYVLGCDKVVVTRRSNVGKPSKNANSLDRAWFDRAASRDHEMAVIYVDLHGQMKKDATKAWKIRHKLEVAYLKAVSESGSTTEGLTALIEAFNKVAESVEKHKCYITRVMTGEDNVPVAVIARCGHMEMCATDKGMTWKKKFSYLLDECNPEAELAEVPSVQDCLHLIEPFLQRFVKAAPLAEVQEVKQVEETQEEAKDDAVVEYL